MLVNITGTQDDCAVLTSARKLLLPERSGVSKEKSEGKTKNRIFENPSILSVHKAGPSFAQRCGGNTIPEGFQCRLDQV